MSEVVNCEVAHSFTAHVGDRAGQFQSGRGLTAPNVKVRVDARVGDFQQIGFKQTNRYTRAIKAQMHLKAVLGLNG